MSTQPAPEPPNPRAPFRLARGRPGPDDRSPLPPGHPDTWGRITAGTCIDGTPYPFPVYPVRIGRA